MLRGDEEEMCLELWREEGIAGALRAVGESIGVRATPTFVIGVVRGQSEIVGWAVEGLRPKPVMQAFIEAAVQVGG